MLKSQELLPVVLSIVILITVAVVQRQSKLAAALLTTMPVLSPLALWVVYSSAQGDAATVSRFSLGMLLGLLSTGVFLLVIWLGARAGWRLGPMLLAGYGAWGVLALLIFGFRRFLGV